MSNDLNFHTAFATFAQYGMRRTSMDDLAQALGVSRQTIYNRFKTKKAVWTWAVTSFAADSLERAIAELNANTPIIDRIVASQMRWLGDYVTLLRAAPHGAEILERSIEALHDKEGDPGPVYLAALAKSLSSVGNDTNPDDLAFTLKIAGKGLMAISPTSEAFEEGIRRIAKILLSPKP